jgi:GH25 family lysozyme M1 (1,4-beta-N-acetylmuramidase)
MPTLQTVIILLLVAITAGVSVLLAQTSNLARNMSLGVLRPYDYWSRRFKYPLDEIISSAEAEAQVRLTWGAREMLTIPVIELVETGAEIDWRQVDSSIRDIVRTMAEENSAENLPRRERNAVSVIRGFSQRFCNIPPFCARTGEARPR